MGPRVPGVECAVCGGTLHRRTGRDAYFCERCRLERLPIPRGSRDQERLKQDMVLREARASAELPSDEDITLTEEELRDLVGDD